MTTDPDAYFILQVDSQAEDYVIRRGVPGGSASLPPDGNSPDVARMTS
jgi:hypothetical protein